MRSLAVEGSDRNQMMAVAELCAGDRLIRRSVISVLQAIVRRAHRSDRSARGGRGGGRSMSRRAAHRRCRSRPLAHGGRNLSGRLGERSGARIGSAPGRGRSDAAPMWGRPRRDPAPRASRRRPADRAGRRCSMTMKLSEARLAALMAARARRLWKVGRVWKRRGGESLVRQSARWDRWSAPAARPLRQPRDHRSQPPPPPPRRRSSDDRVPDEITEPTTIATLKAVDRPRGAS